MKKILKLLTILAPINVLALSAVNVSCSSSKVEGNIIISSDKEKNQCTTLSEQEIDIKIETNISDVIWNVSIDSSKDASRQDEIVFDQTNKKIKAKKNSMGVIKLFAQSKDGQIVSNTLEFWFYDEFKFGLEEKTTSPSGNYATVMFDLVDNPDYDGPVVIPPQMRDAHSSAKPIQYTVTVWFNASGGLELKMKNIYIDDGVANIKNGAFTKCGRLEYIRWPKSTTVIKSSTFAMCQNLKKVDNIDSVVTIEGDAFRACYKLSDITLPSGLETIGDDSFRLCTSLQKIHIPKTLKSFDTTTFECCDNLKDITVDEQNETYTSYNANCICKKGGHTILVGGLKTELNNPNIDTIGENSFSGRAFEHLTIPPNITSIESVAFQNCNQLQSITIGKNVSKIGAGILYGCINLINIDLTQNSSLTEIPASMFIGCSSLTEYEVPTNITKIGACAFLISGLKKIKLHDNITDIETSAFAESKLESLELPSKVTAVSDLLCFSDIKLKDVTFKGNITSIGASAFYETAIESIQIPNSCATIDNYAFSACTSLETIDLSKTQVTNISNGVFQNCNSLETIKLNDNTTKIGQQSFSSCSSLKQIDFSQLSKLTSIGMGCFEHCESLTNVKLPDALTEIGSNAFLDCTNLKSDNINIPTSLKTIGSSAFRYCGYITKFIAPSTLTTIGDRAFDQTGLAEVDLSAFTTLDSIPTVGTEAFSRIQEGKIKFLVKDATMLNNFKTSQKGWSNYLDETKFTWEVKQ